MKARVAYSPGAAAGPPAGLPTRPARAAPFPLLTRVPLSLQMNLASMVSSYTPPAVYVKHVCFVNFTQ